MSPLAACSNATLSPAFTPRARRVSAGMVIWPLLVILATRVLAGGSSGRILAVAGMAAPYLTQYTPYLERRMWQISEDLSALVEGPDDHGGEGHCGEDSQREQSIEKE